MPESKTVKRTMRCPECGYSYVVPWSDDEARRQLHLRSDQPVAYGCPKGCNAICSDTTAS